MKSPWAPTWGADGPDSHPQSHLEVTRSSSVCRVSCFVYPRLTLFIILLMEEILYQVVDRLSIIYKVLYILSGAGFLPPTVALSYFEGFPPVRTFWNGKKKRQFSSRRSSGCMSFLFCGLLLCPQSEEGTAAQQPPWTDVFRHKLPRRQRKESNWSNEVPNIKDCS